MRSLATKGVRGVRPSPRDKRTVAQRDEDEVDRRKKILARKALRPKNGEKRERRKRAKKRRAGEKILRKHKLIH